MILAVTFSLGIAIGFAIVIVVNRLMYAHPDEALCLSCDKTFNTRKRTMDCPHIRLAKGKSQ